VFSGSRPKRPALQLTLTNRANPVSGHFGLAGDATGTCGARVPIASRCASVSSRKRRACSANAGDYPEVPETVIWWLTGRQPGKPP